jgi:hypothetical protein
MSSAAALALYPLWAVALAVGLTALRLGRSVGRGLVILCFALATWVTGLVLLVSADGAPGGALASAGLAERVLPARDAPRRRVPARGRRRREDHRSPRRPRRLRVQRRRRAPRRRVPPASSTAPACAVPARCSSLSRSSPRSARSRRSSGSSGSPAGRPQPQRRRGLALVIANLAATLGGGGAIALRVFGLAPIELAAPFLFLSIVLATIRRRLRGEGPRPRGARAGARLRVAHGALLCVRPRRLLPPAPAPRPRDDLRVDRVRDLLRRAPPRSAALDRRRDDRRAASSRAPSRSIAWSARSRSRRPSASKPRASPRWAASRAPSRTRCATRSA